MSGFAETIVAGLKRVVIFLLIALIGFVVGYVVYYIGRFVGDFAKDYVMILLNWLAINPDFRNAFISGIIGMIFAIVIAYLWAKSSE